MRRREFTVAAGAALLAAAVGTRATGGSPAPIPGGDPGEAQRYERERKYAQTRYGRIAYVERGQGPALLLLHGFPLNGLQWRGVLARLRTQRRCVAPDFMGLGFSEVPRERSIALGPQADMLAAFLDGLGIRQVDIIANDSGGAVAQLFIARHAARVRTLLLTNCDVENDSPPESVVPIIELARHGQYTEQYLRPWLKDKESLRSSSAFGRLCYSCADPNRVGNERSDLLAREYRVSGLGAAAGDRHLQDRGREVILSGRASGGDRRGGEDALDGSRLGSRAA